MPKLIFTSRYLRDAPPEQPENYVRYVSTHEGVEKVEGNRENLPATAQQKDLISQIVRDIPPAKEMLEYTDFLLRPTIGQHDGYDCHIDYNKFYLQFFNHGLSTSTIYPKRRTALICTFEPICFSFLRSNPT